MNSGNARGVKKLCAVKSRRFSVGGTPTRQRVARAGSNQGDGGGNKFVETSDVTNRLGRFSAHVSRNASQRTRSRRLSFMLRIGTPPNAVVFGTGRVPMQVMMRYGLWLNLIGAILIPCLMYLFGLVLLG
jgi:hypothetical protein